MNTLPLVEACPVTYASLTYLPNSSSLLLPRHCFHILQMVGVGKENWLAWIAIAAAAAATAATAGTNLRCY